MRHDTNGKCDSELDPLLLRILLGRLVKPNVLGSSGGSRLIP